MKKMMTNSQQLAAISLAIFLFIFPTFAQNNTFDLLRIDASPRTSALGGHPVAISYGDVGAMGSNVAGLADQSRKQFLATYADHPLELASGYLAFGRPVKNGYGAISLTYFNYGEFDKFTTYDQEESEGTFTASDILLTTGWARHIPYVDGLSGGASVKLLHSSIDEYSSTALAMDLSALWKTGWEGVDVGLTLANIGSQLSSYDGVSESLPMMAHLGVAKQLAHLPLQVTATGHYEINDDVTATAGGEFTVSPNLKIRAGYTTLSQDYKVEGSEDSIAGISAGLGINFMRYQIDYAFYSQGALGQVHRFGVSAIL